MIYQKNNECTFYNDNHIIILIVGWQKKALNAKRVKPEERDIRMYVEQQRMKLNAEIVVFRKPSRPVTINDALFSKNFPHFQMAVQAV
jgi:hypothetical protein